MHHWVRVNHSESTYLCCFSRLRINLVLNVDTLPVSLEKFLQVLLSAYEFLACTSTWRSISDLLLRQLVFQLLLSAAMADSGSCPRPTHMLMMLVMVALLCLHFWGASSTSNLSLKNCVAVRGHLMDMVNRTWLHILWWCRLLLFLIVFIWRALGGLLRTGGPII